MAQLKTIRMTDESGVQQTFTPVVKDGLLVTFASDIGKTIATKARLSLSMRPGRLRKKDSERVKRKVTLKVSVPYQPKLVDGVTPPVDNVEVVVSFNAPVDAEINEIRNALSFARGSILDSQVEDALENGHFPY